MSLFIDPSLSYVCNNSTVGEVFHAIPENVSGIFQIFFLIAVYGIILYYASNLIAEGSDLLMLILNPGLVGGLLLPVMSAVPDGAMVLFSGMGSREKAQEQLFIGVGTLAGSTIMLLTLPWFLATYHGKVEIAADGEANYRSRSIQSSNSMYNINKKNINLSDEMTKMGVTSGNEIKSLARAMIFTSFIYFIIQGPAFSYLHEKDEETVAKSENMWALLGFVSSLFAFFCYSYFQVKSANAQEIQKNKIKAYRSKAFKERIVDLAFLVHEEEELKKAINNKEINETTPLHTESQVESILKHSFDKYDSDKSGYLNRMELKAMFTTLNINLDPRDIKLLLEQMDTDADGQVSFSEYKNATIKWLLEDGTEGGHVDENTTSPSSTTKKEAAKQLHRKISRFSQSSNKPVSDIPDYLHEDDENDDDTDENENEPPLTPSQITKLSLTKLICGVLVVTLFSDPMCDALADLGKRLNIPAFYISFFITPLSSNASELIAAIYFGKKRTKASITLAYSTLLGAATMNNTFCLSIFLGIVYFRQLAWEFSAEVMAILFVEISMGILCINNTFTLRKAYMVLSLFPLSVLIVASLNYIGWK